MADQESGGDSARTLWRLSGLGMEFVAALVGAGLLGWLIDYWAGTFPRWTIVGVLLGLLGGGYNFFKQALQASREANEAFQREHPSRRDSPRSTESDRR